MYAKWKEIMEDEKLKKLCDNIQENIIDDYLNYDDYEVGIYSVGKIDNDTVVEIESFYEDGSLFVSSWGMDNLILEVDNSYMVTITLDNQCEEWIISDARKKYFSEYSNDY